MLKNEDEDFDDYLSNIKEENEVNPINTENVMNWGLDQSQEKAIQMTKFFFKLSGLTSNKEAAKINNRSASAETQYGKKEQIGHFRYSKIEA